MIRTDRIAHAMTMTICLFINLTNPSESPTPHAADTDGLPGHVWSSKQQIDRGRRRWRVAAAARKAKGNNRGVDGCGGGEIRSESPAGSRHWETPLSRRSVADSTDREATRPQATAPHRIASSDDPSSSRPRKEATYGSRRPCSPAGLQVSFSIPRPTHHQQQLRSSS